MKTKDRGVPTTKRGIVPYCDFVRHANGTPLPALGGLPGLDRIGACTPSVAASNANRRELTSLPLSPGTIVSQAKGGCGWPRIWRGQTVGGGPELPG